ncbi:hypothetical protein VNI00_010640 [Paramarasmius palmivorus]|uniref:Uncharacterized protein n=1 Tax=Paramarasmius palmivorus TaxID=297713 RepID=A0AAW0CL87_9AGAR
MFYLLMVVLGAWTGTFRSDQAIGLLASLFLDAVKELAYDFISHCLPNDGGVESEASLDHVHPSTSSTTAAGSSTLESSHDTRLSRLHSSLSTAPGIPPPHIPRVLVDAKTIDLPSGARIDVEYRYRATESFSHVYFRVWLEYPSFLSTPLQPLPTTFSIFRDPSDPTNSSKFRLFFSRPLIRFGHNLGKATLGYAFVEQPIQGYFAPIPPILFKSGCICVPRPEQVLKDVITSVVAPPELAYPVHGGVDTLPSAVLSREGSRTQHLANNVEGMAGIPAGHLPKEVDALRIEGDRAQDEWIAMMDGKHVVVPEVRRFIFEAMEDSEPGKPPMLYGLPNDLKLLPLEQLTHVTLNGVHITFDDCVQLISRCPKLDTLCLGGSGIGSPKAACVESIFGEDSTVRDTRGQISTRMRRLEIHRCDVDVRPLVRQLKLMAKGDLVLNVSSKGAKALTLRTTDLHSFGRLSLPSEFKKYQVIARLAEQIEYGKLVDWV